MKRRAAFGLQPAVAPAIVLVPAGYLLGPRGADILSLEVLAHLQVGVSLGLALLGVFVGRALAKEFHNTRLVAAGNIESAATIAVTGLSLWFAITRGHVPVGASAVLVALSLAIAAAASSGHIADPRADPAAHLASRVADFDDVLLIAAGGVLLVFIRSSYGPVPALLVLSPIVIGAAVAAAGLLLFERSEGESERGLLVLGAVALLGGSSAYLMTSSLAAGLVAGVVWTVAPGRADAILTLHAQKLERPLVALVLLTAGAFFVPQPAVLWLLPSYVLFRLVGKIIGAFAAAPLLPSLRGRGLELTGYVLQPGVVGVGFALTCMLALPAEAGEIVISVAGAGTVVSELLGLFALPGTAARTRTA